MSANLELAMRKRPAGAGRFNMLCSFVLWKIASSDI